jgi:hypothetical protein
VNRESGSERNVRGGNRTGVRATLAAPRKGSKQVNRLGWCRILVGSINRNLGGLGELFERTDNGLP